MKLVLFNRAGRGGDEQQLISPCTGNDEITLSIRHVGATVKEGRGKEEAMQITLTHGDSNNKTAQGERERTLNPLYSKGLKSRRAKAKEERKRSGRRGGTMLLLHLLLLFAVSRFK